MKIAVLGRGTAGAQSAAHLVKNFPHHEIEWHYDPNIPTQAVGEGSQLSLARDLKVNLNMSYEDLKSFDAFIKLGVHKVNWGKAQREFNHDFPFGNLALHFNARGLQDFIHHKLKNKLTVVEHNTSAEQIDADYIIDCSGVPNDLDDLNIPKYIPVNSVHVTQCYWDYPKFTHTLAIARPYGWVFGIPLKNRCSIGYIYNKDINTIDEVKDDVKNVFIEYGLTPSEDTNTFNFKNYYRKQNFNGNIFYNGNASFFLEPLEATSLTCMSFIQESATNIIKQNMSQEHANEDYIKFIRSVENMIMLHYFAGSTWDTEFWKFAQQRGEQCMIEASSDPNFVRSCKFAFEDNPRLHKNKIKGLEMGWESFDPHRIDRFYGTWPPGSYSVNINNLGIKEKLSKLLD